MSARLNALLLAVVSLAQEPGNLLDRIRNSHLPPEQRDALAASFSAKDYARMEQILDGQSSQSGEVQALLGAVAFLCGHTDRAALAFRKADAATPLGEPDRFTWAMALLNLGDARSARDQLTRLSAAHPDRPLYLYWLARIDYDQRLYEAAVVKLKRVIQLDPSSSRAYDNLGLAFDMMGEYEEARNAFLKAVELNRKLPEPSPWPPHNLGYLLLRLDLPKEAEAALRESLKYDPRLAISRYHLGRVLEAEGRDADAIPEYQSAATLDPKSPEPLYSLGILYRRSQHVAEADQAFAEYRKRRAASASQ